MFCATLLASITLGLPAQVVAALPRLPLPKPSATAVPATVHDNTVPGGTRAGGVVTLRLEVVESAWRPEGDAEPEVPILAFREPGKRPTVPGPLLRVRRGTEVRVIIESRVDSALTIGGLRPGVDSSADTVQLKAKGSRELRFRLDKPGTYFYWGALGRTNWSDRLWLDSQLNGAIVVDADAEPGPDHIFLISEWFHPYNDRPFEVVSLINGKGWPHTSRLTLQQGDSTRFRVINTIALFHPMHLHGFYYRVEARGNWEKDGPIAPAMQPILNTDLLAPGGTLTLAFLPTTPGNWLLHCHFSFHMDETVTLGEPPHSPPGGPAPEHRMHGLVVGLKVLPAPGYVARRAEHPRRIRLLVQKKPGRLILNSPAYGFLVQKDSVVPARDSVELPGPVLELERGKPVAITVVNNLSEPTGIHWHGLEIESFPDGVANWSGMDARIFPPIAPGDSFVAEFTPPRSGTYPYHSHLNERHQISSGMYGAIVVSDHPRDLALDHVIVAGGGGPELEKKIESPFALVNGSRSPAPLRLTVGEVHRLRILSVHPDWRIAFTLRTDSSVARWRAIAKDGHDLPPPQATERAAHVEMGPGETADFEFRPLTPGEWRLEVRSVDTGWYIPLTVIVGANPPAAAKP